MSNAPFVCAKCGAVFSARALGQPDEAGVICRVCGGELQRRDSAHDPKPSRKGEGWLWLAAFPWELVAVAIALAAALTAWFKR